MGTRYARNYMSPLTSYGLDKLKRFQSWKTLQDYQYDMVLIGDSFTHGGYWAGLFRDLLLGDGYTDGGPGWTGFGWAGSSQTLRNHSIDTAELDYSVADEADWTKTYGDGGYGAAVEHLVSAGTDKTITVSCGVALDTLKVLYMTEPNGVPFRHRIDSGIWQDVNTTSDTVLYENDFSTATTGMSGLSNCTLDSNIDGIGSRDNNLRMTSTAAGSGRAKFQRFGSLTAGVTYRATYEVYIPSTNTAIDQVASLATDTLNPLTGSLVTDLDQWVSVDFEFAPASTIIEFSGLDGGSNFYTVPAGDIFYIRNLQVTAPSTGSTSVATETIDVSGAGSSFDVSIQAVGAGTTLLGAIGRTSGSNALCVHKLGSSGGRASFFAESTYWPDSIAELTPKGATIMFGTNEHNANVSPTDYATNIQTIITELRAIDSNMDIILMCPGPTKYGNTVSKTYQLSEYRDQLFDLAKSNGCAFIDFGSTFGPWSSDLVTDQFIHSDEVHPGTRGKYLYSNRLHKAFS